MDDFEERFLQANANADYMSSILADFLRNCMRASVSNEPSSQTYRAVENFMTLLKLVNRSDKVSPFDLIEKAIEQITVDDEEDMPVGNAVDRAAKAGVRYLVESSCDDNAARGRASRRESEFMSAIRWIEEERAGKRSRVKL